MSNQFIKDRQIVEREAYKDIKKKDFYHEEDSIRLIFIYYFINIDPDEYEIDSNRYLDKIEPYYKYSNFILSFPLKKRLRSDVYALDKDNNIIALRGCGIESNEFRSYIDYPPSDMYEKKHNGLMKNVFSQDFDLHIRQYVHYGEVWCIKNKETYIYNEDTEEIISLKEYYEELELRKSR